jgi:dihydroorotate dehydrogenase subfamily 1
MCGISLENPVIVASSPLTRSAKNIIRCLKAGAAAAVTKTITYDLMQRIQPKPRMYILRADDMRKGSFYSFYSVDLMSEIEPEKWINEIRTVKKSVGDDKVVIASVAGRSVEEWEKLAELAKEAEADMIELNFSCPHIERGEIMGRSITSNPEAMKDVIRVVKKKSGLKTIGKLTPHGANPEILAELLAGAGIDALVSVARFQGLIIDVDSMRPILWESYGGYGGPWQLPISLSWTAHIAMKNLNVPIIGSGGISSWQDIASFILVGASAVQICTSIMLRGHAIIAEYIDGLKNWMNVKGFSKLSDFRGLALPFIKPLERLEREKIFKIFVKDGCKGCGICVKTCPYEAITLINGKAFVNEERCDNCGLCISICPFQAIEIIGEF